MIRFLAGVLVGALAVLAIQLGYAPLPGRVTGDEGAATLTNTRAWAPTAESMPAPTASPSAAPIQSNDIARTTSARERTRPSTSSAEPDRPRSPVGPVRNPIALPPTHAGFVSKTPPALPDAHAELEREEVDASWADLVEQLIAGHIAGHALGQSIALIALECRTTRCEIAGTVYGEGGAQTWDTVLASMQEQPWYAAYFGPSRWGSGGSFPGEFRFVTILARVGTDIPPPVEP